MPGRATPRSVFFHWRLSTCVNILDCPAGPLHFYLMILLSSLRDPCPDIVIPRLVTTGKRKTRRSPTPQGGPVSAMSPFPSRRLPNSDLRLCPLPKLRHNAAMGHTSPSLRQSITGITLLYPRIFPYSLG